MRRSQARQTTIRTVLPCFFLLSLQAPAFAWGDRGHQMVNAAAVENLPEPLRSYFRLRKTFLVDHAADLDQLAKENPEERPHHYSEVEAYDAYPFPNFRRQFVDERRGPTALQLRHGDSLWQIEQFTFRLVEAFRRRRWDEADRVAVSLAHYACDLTQPLHTVVNYDGQLTNQRGIHARFESDLVSALHDQWILDPRPTENEMDLRARIFREYLESNRESKMIYAADRLASAGRSRQNIEYFQAFEKLLGPLAKKRLEAAVSFVSSLWYTAWVRADKPRWPTGAAGVKQLAGVPR